MFKKSHILIPVYGIILFVLLYLIATFYYPGGSQADLNSKGFSWQHNYWCNLLNKYAMNDQPNPARPIAISAMIILCFSLIYFWFNLPIWIHSSNAIAILIRTSGILAMGISLLLFTSLNHDLISNIAALLGLVASTCTFLIVMKLHRKFLVYHGLINFAMILLNSFLYYNKDLISYLPIVQKVTFASFLSWIISINLIVYIQKKKVIH